MHVCVCVSLVTCFLVVSTNFCFGVVYIMNILACQYKACFLYPEFGEGKWP